MTPIADKKDARFRKIQFWAVVVTFLLFAIFVASYERHIRRAADATINVHARVVADALWNYNYQAASEYLELACEAFKYDTLMVFEETGEIFYKASGSELGRIDRLLKAVNLIPTKRLESDVAYQGKNIGRVEANWNVRTIYAHAAVFLFLLMGLAVFLLYVRIFQANQLLEERVRERTSRLAEANTLLHDEIEEREKIEKKLRQNEENLRITLNSIGDAVIATDIEGRIVRMNPVGEKLTGWRIAEAKGKTLAQVFNIVNARTREKIEGPFERVLETGSVVDLFDHALLLSLDGKEYQVADSGAPILDKDGHITGVVLVFRDVTEDYRIREALRQSEKQLRKTQSVARMGSWRLSVETGEVVLTPEASWIYGLRKDCEVSGCEMELTIQELQRLPLLEYRKMFEEKLNMLTHGESECEVEFKIKRPADSRVRDIYLVAAYDPENKVVTGTTQDITERKQAEAELQKMERLQTIGTLAGGIAHDFNNILTGLFGNISVAKIKLDGNHPANFPIAEAEKSLDRVVRLTNQLLTFARGGYPVMEDAMLNHIVEEVVRFDLSGSNVKPVFESADDLWLAKVDKGQVQQVFSNLAINADQAMPEGGRLYINLENAEISETALLPISPGRYIKATVRDEGIGVASNHLEHIFDPYYSIRKNGSGLGLATVHSIIARHGGYISVDSEPGKGTAFVLYLPASEATQMSEAGRHEARGGTRVGTARVLVMDDEEMIRKIASDMLKICGYEVETAADGEEAVEIYKAAMKSGDPFNLVIMDMTVPGGMGGIEAMESILAIDPGAKAIVSSGYSDNELGNLKQYGFVDMLSKPYTLARLREVLDRVMQ